MTLSLAFTVSSLFGGGDMEQWQVFALGREKPKVHINKGSINYKLGELG